MSKIIYFLQRVKCFFGRYFSFEIWYLNHIVGKKIKDHCIMILPPFLGDSFLVLANIKVLEIETDVMIFPLLHTNQTVIAELCHYQEYAVFTDISNVYCLPCVKKAYKCFFGNQVKAKMKPEIKVGTLFFAHPNHYLEIFQYYVDNPLPIPKMYCHFLKLQCNLKFPSLVNQIEFHSEIPDPGNTIMLCPDAKSTRLLPPDFWSCLYSALCNQGWNIYYNSTRPLEFLPKGAWINCSLHDAVAIGQKAAFVISLRSGLTDLLANRGDRLIVIYPDRPCFEFFNLNAFFSRTDIFSCIYQQEENAVLSIVNYIQSFAINNREILK